MLQHVGEARVAAPLTRHGRRRRRLDQQRRARAPSELARCALQQRERGEREAPPAEVRIGSPGTRRRDRERKKHRERELLLPAELRGRRDMASAGEQEGERRKEMR